jgi:mRNA interferase MazF
MRSAVVLSPASHNGKTDLMVCCPLTTRIKGYPFKVVLASQPGSAVLSDQVKNLDWRARRAVAKGKVTDQELRQVRGKLRALIG